MTDADAALTLPETWTEAAFERGRYGPDDRPGLAATFECESATAAVLPVRYESEAGREQFRGLTDDVAFARRETTATTPDVEPTTAFAAYLTYRPRDATEEAVVCVAADADDALCAALWVAAASEDGADVREHVRLHRGDLPPGSGRVVPSDDEALGRLFADRPERCALSGRPTRSHAVTVPYRYLPLCPDAPRTDRGVPRLPTTVEALTGVVSHAEWTARDLADREFAAPVERVEAGSYRLAGAATDLAAEFDPAALSLSRLGGGD